MSEFFRLGRRKFGAATIVMACLFAAGWVRSIGHSEQLLWWSEPAAHSLQSTWGHLIWISDFPGQTYIRTTPRWISSPMPNKDLRGYAPGASLTLNGATIGLGSFELRGPYQHYVIVLPYSLIVLPLTLLSAYLLLSKPRPTSMQPVNHA